MPPSTASSTRHKASSRPTLRQSSLSFPSKRSTATSAKDSVKGKGTESSTGRSSRRSSTVPNTPRIDSLADDDDSDEDEEEARRVYRSESDSDGEDTGKEKEGGRKGPPAKRRKLEGSGVAAEPTSSTERDKEKGVFRSRASVENSNGGKTHKDGEEDRPHLNVHDRKWRKLYGDARVKMGNLEPIHAKGLTNVHHILRVFDLSYEYGPCIGVSRLERWERAEGLGLNPPPEVKEILMTKEGVEKDEFKQCVFYGEV